MLYVVVLALAVLGLTRFVLLPALWASPTDPDPNQDECRAGGGHLDARTHSVSGVTTIIRLTDDGEFADRCELTDAIYEVRNCNQPLLAVWYVHGWKHGAGTGDTDLVHFRALVSQLEDEQQRLRTDERRHVVGVYVAWDGTVGPWWTRNLTFWNRKHAADRISQSGVLTKILSAAHYARRQVGAAIVENDVTIMIGHSFGARILFTATSQVLIDEVQRCHPGFRRAGYQAMRGPADLILLLNPAFEASIFTSLQSVRRPDANWWEAMDRRQQPILLAISSEADRATAWTFPVGQWLDWARRSRQLQTLGNHLPFVTHRLVSERSHCPGTVAAEPFWYDAFEAAGLRLERATDRQPGNPFIVARTGADVIDGHNGIWGPHLRGWVIAFLAEIHRRALESHREMAASPLDARTYES